MVIILQSGEDDTTCVRLKRNHVHVEANGRKRSASGQQSLTSGQQVSVSGQQSLTSGQQVSVSGR